MKKRREVNEALIGLRALREGVAKAMDQHRRYGVPLHVEQNGKLVALDPRTMKVIKKGRQVE